MLTTNMYTYLLKVHAQLRSGSKVKVKKKLSNNYEYFHTHQFYYICLGWSKEPYHPAGLNLVKK